jgi:hypothetical protein
LKFVGLIPELLTEFRLLVESMAPEVLAEAGFTNLWPGATTQQLKELTKAGQKRWEQAWVSRSEADKVALIDSALTKVFRPLISRLH